MNYDNESWYRIIKVLNSKNYADIHVLNRAAIVDDLLNLARTGFLPYPTAFDGLQYLKRENNYYRQGSDNGDKIGVMVGE